MAEEVANLRAAAVLSQRRVGALPTVGSYQVKIRSHRKLCFIGFIGLK
jgi:hypothetical protein